MSTRTSGERRHPGHSDKRAAARTPRRRTESRKKFAAALASPTWEVPREDWCAYLDDFSVEHDGCLSDIRACHPNHAPLLQASGLPFEGISAELGQAGAYVLVIAGKEAGDHITHVIPHATRITALGEDALEVESDDRNRTRVQCHPATS